MTDERGRAKQALVAGATGAFLLGAGYVARTWLRYGRTATTGADPDPLLERFLPHPEVRDVHQMGVAAPADITWAAACALDFRQSPVIRAIFRGRELLMRSGPGAERPGNFLEQIRALGWRQLAEEPGRELVFGAVTRPWEANVVFRGVSPEAFAGFDEPDYARIAWTLRVEPAGERSVFSTETRVDTTDADARRKFRRYWSLMSPGILLIRRESLRLVRREAERRGRTVHA
jgi:hypothetical protein